MDAIHTFCRQVRTRSTEHREAVHRLEPGKLYGQIAAILRQELDSMVRVIYLLSVSDRKRRHELIEASVKGKAWTHVTGGRRITDREMVDLADRLHGWTESVYRFGCDFIHLSSFHDYRARDPMDAISDDERRAILRHMRYYHGGPVSDRPSFDELASFLPMVFEKIASHLECYVKGLENGEDIDA